MKDARFDPVAPDDSLSAITLIELLADCVAGAEKTPSGLNMEWLMDQLFDKGDRR